MQLFIGGNVYFQHQRSQEVLRHPRLSVRSSHSLYKEQLGNQGSLQDSNDSGSYQVRSVNCWKICWSKSEGFKGQISIESLNVPEEVKSWGDGLIHFCLNISAWKVLSRPGPSMPFKNSFGIQHLFTKYLEQSCRFGLIQQKSYQYFLNKALVRKIWPKLSGRFWALQTWMG